MDKAFTYMFKDNMIGKKALSYFLLAFCLDFVLKVAGLYSNKETTLIYAAYLFVLAIILSFPFYGYAVSCVHSIMEQRDNVVLPFLNYGKNFIQGFKYFIANMLIATLMLSVSCLFIIVPITVSYAGAKVLSIILLLLSMLIIILLFIAFLIYILALTCIFAKTENLTSFCRFILATKLIKNAPAQYFISLIIYIGVGIIIGIVDAIISLITFNIAVSLIGSIISGVIATYFLYVSSYIIARSVDHNLIEVKTKEL